MNITSDNVLTMERHLNASPEHVFAAFGTVEGMKKWMGPGYCNMTEGTMDFVEGGTYHFSLLINNEKTVGLTGQYELIDPPNKLVFTWQWENNGEEDYGPTHVTFEFLPADGNTTTLRLTHKGFPARETAEHHNLGWSGSFDKLEALFAN